MPASLPASHTLTTKHRLTQHFARAISGWKVRIWKWQKFNEHLTSVSWNVLAVDKKNKPAGAVKCSVACCHQSKLSRTRFLTEEHILSKAAEINSFSKPTGGGGGLFSHENEIRGRTLTSHHSISGKRNPSNTASTGIANTQQSAIQHGLQATRCNPRAGERKHD